MSKALVQLDRMLNGSEQESRYAIELYARLNSTTPTDLYVLPDEAHIRLQPRRFYEIPVAFMCAVQ